MCFQSMVCATVLAQWSLVVREPHCSGFHTIVIAHFNAIEIAFLGWFQRIGKKGTTWQASLFARTLLIQRTILSDLSFIK
jgi:hypothetical protein